MSSGIFTLYETMFLLHVFKACFNFVNFFGVISDRLRTLFKTLRFLRYMPTSFFDFHNMTGNHS